MYNSHIDLKIKIWQYQNKDIIRQEKIEEEETFYIL